MDKLSFAPGAWDEYITWQTRDKKTLKRINELIRDLAREPLGGIGKPEPLRYLKNAWSRRIDEKNRLVYELRGDEIIILSCMGHYEE